MATVRKYRGRWVADFRDQNGQRRIEVPKGEFETLALEKRAAHEHLQQRLNEVHSNSYTSRSSALTFEQVAEMWIDSKVKIRKTTLSDYRIQLDCYLLPYFGPRRIAIISRIDIERFRADMSKGIPDSVKRARELRARTLDEKGRPVRLRPLKPGPRTTNKCLSILGFLFNYALINNLVLRNVADRMDKLPTDEQSEFRVIEENVLNPYELVQTLSSSEDPYTIPIALAAYCGLRESEVLGLQWEDIDWSQSTAEIRRQQRRGEFWVPKTKSSRRTIELPKALLPQLEKWRLKCPKSERNLVCPSITGLPMQASALLQRGFHPALERAGIRRVRYHDLRHSFASNLLMDGVDVVTVSKALGHANVHITLTTYAHAVPKPRQGASDRMAALLEGSGNKMETGAEKESGPFDWVAG